MEYPTSPSTMPSTPASPPANRPWNFSTKAVAEARHAQTKAMNPNFDRTPAKINEPDPTKLSIIIHHPAPKRPTQLSFPHEIDWFDIESIKSLNKWRRRSALYWFGTISGKSRYPTGESPIPHQVGFCDVEKAWLLREGNNINLTWDQIVRRFNGRFEGAIIRGCRLRRPVRTERQLKVLYRNLLRKEAASLEAEGEKNTRREESAEAGSESELEEGEIREYPQTPRSDRPWEL